MLHKYSITVLTRLKIGKRILIAATLLGLYKCNDRGRGYIYFSFFFFYIYIATEIEKKYSSSITKYTLIIWISYTFKFSNVTFLTFKSSFDITKYIKT